MKSLVIKELKIMLKEKGNVFFLILMPMMFIVLFASILGNIGNSSITVNYVDQDQSITSEEFIKQIGEIDGFELEQGEGSVHAQVEQIKEGDLASLLVIPEGFEETVHLGNAPAQVEFYRDPNSGELASPIQAVLNNISNSYREQKLASTLHAMGVNDQETTNFRSRLQCS